MSKKLELCFNLIDLLALSSLLVFHVLHLLLEISHHPVELKIFILLNNLTILFNCLRYLLELFLSLKLVGYIDS